MPRSTRSSAGMPSPTTPTRQTRSSHAQDLEGLDTSNKAKKGASASKTAVKAAPPARTNTRSMQKRKLSQTSASSSGTADVEGDEADDTPDADDGDDEDDQPEATAPSHGRKGISSRHKTGLRTNKHKKLKLSVKTEAQSSTPNDDVAVDSDEVEFAASDDEDANDELIERMEEEYLRTDLDLLNDLEIDYQQQAFLQRYDVGGDGGDQVLIQDSLGVPSLSASDPLLDMSSAAAQDGRHVHFHVTPEPRSSTTDPAPSLLPSALLAGGKGQNALFNPPLGLGQLKSHLFIADPLPAALLEHQSQLNIQEGDDTEDDEAPPQINPAPHQFLLRRPSSGPAAAIEHPPPAPRRKGKTAKKKTGPMLGEFAINPTKPYAIFDGGSKHVAIHRATAPGYEGRAWFHPASSLSSTLDASPKTPAANLFYESDQIASTPVDFSFGGEVNIIMPGIDSHHFDGFATGPPEAFFADGGMPLDTDVDDLIEFDDDDDEDDGEDNIDLTALIDFGDTSSEEDANMQSEVETPISSSFNTRPASNSVSSAANNYDQDIKHPTRENVLAWQRRADPPNDWYDLASNYQLSSPSKTRGNPATKPVNFTSPPRKTKSRLAKATSTSPILAE